MKNILFVILLTSSIIYVLKGVLNYSMHTDNNTITADISPLPSGMNYNGSNTITGDISPLPSGMNYNGSNTITGDISPLPSGMNYSH